MWGRCFPEGEQKKGDGQSHWGASSSRRVRATRRLCRWVPVRPHQGQTRPAQAVGEVNLKPGCVAPSCSGVRLSPGGTWQFGEIWRLPGKGQRAGGRPAASPRALGLDLGPGFGTSPAVSLSPAFSLLVTRLFSQVTSYRTHCPQKLKGRPCALVGGPQGWGCWVVMEGAGGLCLTWVASLRAE